MPETELREKLDMLYKQRAQDLLDALKATPEERPILAMTQAKRDLTAAQRQVIEARREELGEFNYQVAIRNIQKNPPKMFQYISERFAELEDELKQLGES